MLEVNLRLPDASVDESYRNGGKCPEGHLLYFCDGHDPRCDVDKTKPCYCRLVSGQPGCRHTPDPYHSISENDPDFPETVFYPVGRAHLIEQAEQEHRESVEIPSGYQDMWIENFVDEREYSEGDEQHDCYALYRDFYSYLLSDDDNIATWIQHCNSFKTARK